MAKYIVVAPNGQEVTVGMPFGEPVTLFHGEVITSDYIATMFPDIFQKLPEIPSAPVVAPVPDEKVEPPKVTEEKAPKAPKKPAAKNKPAASKGKGKGKGKKNTFTRG